MEKIFAEGLYFDRRDGAPDFVKGRLSIQLDRFTEWAKKHVTEKGYVNIDIKESRDAGKFYAELNTWKKEAPTRKTLNTSAGPIDYPQEEGDSPF